MKSVRSVESELSGTGPLGDGCELGPVAPRATARRLRRFAVGLAALALTATVPAALADQGKSTTVEGLSQTQIRAAVAQLASQSQTRAAANQAILGAFYRINGR
ncbi:hypothetical protein FraQA3DRAFT_3573 [Frankia sp. QA3]|nr:hypothetical protein FraQA3DRAFT_3573 [Frankia sp. QA3]